MRLVALAGLLAACHSSPRTRVAVADCGVDALVMVASSWGRTWSADALERELPPGRQCRLGTLRDLARARGLDAYALVATPRDLAYELGAGRPVVLGLIGRYEVAIAMPDDGSVITVDPRRHVATRRTRAELEAEWQPTKHAALVVRGDPP